jgi:hypothetical protein
VRLGEREGRGGDSGGSIAVDGGVEGWIVVHLQLAVKLEAARSGEGGLPELVEATSKVGALLLKDVETLGVAQSVAGRRCRIAGGAINFFSGVEDFQGKDGEAVDDEAGRLGVERCVGIGESTLSEFGEEVAVELLGEVVSVLICEVDAALSAGEDCIGSAGGAGFVFDVP